jgi:hypothetical protein
MRFALLILMVSAVVQAETQSNSSCRHCGEEASDTGRLVSTCTDGQPDSSCHWVVRYERTTAARKTKTKDQVDVEAALGNVNLIQPVQIRGDEASALIAGSGADFQVVYAKKSANGWQVMKIIHVPTSRSNLSLQQK